MAVSAGKVGIALIVAITIIVIVAVVVGGKQKPPEPQPETPCVGAKTPLFKCSGATTICDAKHNKCIVAGDVPDGTLYHQAAGERRNARWWFVPVDADNYLIVDDLHGYCIVAGGNDGRVYHQPGRLGRQDMLWRVRAFGDKVQIVSAKYGTAIVAGDVYNDSDPRVYLQEPKARLNSLWTLSACALNPAMSGTAKAPCLIGTSSGVKCNAPTTICDKRHGKCIIGGNVYDGAVYHDDPTGYVDTTWNIIPWENTGANLVCDSVVGQCLMVNPGKYDGYVYHGNARLCDEARAACPLGQPAQQWVLKPGPDPGQTMVCSKLYPGMCLTAGLDYDRSVYVRAPPAAPDQNASEWGSLLPSCGSQ